MAEKTCGTCIGSGKVRCAQCGGTGHGSAYSSNPFCTTCGGNSRVTCRTCGGRGRVRDYNAERRAKANAGEARADAQVCALVTIALLSPFAVGAAFLML